MNTIIYGGAFDPPHQAHEYIVRHIAKEFQPSRLLIVPSGPRFDKTYKVVFEHRTRILSIFAESLSDIGAELWDDFMTGRIADGTTLGVDRAFRERFGHSPVQVFGTDVIPNMRVWDPSGQVECQIPKVFVIREGAPMPDFSRLDNYRTIVPEIPPDMATLSSTEIRKNIQKRVYRGLHPEIAEYVQKHDLYR